VVADPEGRVVRAWGDADLVTYPRSALKAVQALPLVATGAAAAFGFGDRELALAVASHNAEPGHLEVAATMLAACGLDEGALACGPTWPYRTEDALALAAAGGTPSPIRNCCSGKHAGFLAVARHLGHPTEGYTRPDHPVQAMVAATIEAVTGARLDEPGVDGCSAPIWALPLRHLATGFARVATGEGLDPDLAAAASRLRTAMTAEPWLVAGTGRFCTEVIEATGGAALVKYGADGVFTAALPTLGLGLAVKVDDGSARAAELATAAVLARLLPDVDLDGHTRRPVLSRAGEVVGEAHGLVPDGEIAPRP
jgi:L-asparaginase II